MIVFSILIPSYNELDNLQLLVEKIKKIFNKKLNNKFEVIIIDDGSVDGTVKEIKKKILKNKFLKLIELKKNFGKAKALDCGLSVARGKIIGCIDADNQYEPEDFLKMIKFIDRGYDVVNGKRKYRKDKKIFVISSKIIKFLIRSIFLIKNYDYFSGIKVFKKDIFHRLKYSGMLRYLVILSNNYQFQLKEISVYHLNRKYGDTKYSYLKKCILGISDLLKIFIYLFISKKIFIITIMLNLIYLIFFSIDIFYIYFLYFLSLIFFSLIFFYLLNKNNKKKINGMIKKIHEVSNY